MDQSENVTAKTFHICPGSVHDHIFCQKWPKIVKKDKSRFSGKLLARWARMKNFAINILKFSIVLMKHPAEAKDYGHLLKAIRQNNAMQA